MFLQIFIFFNFTLSYLNKFLSVFTHKYKSDVHPLSLSLWLFRNLIFTSGTIMFFSEVSHNRTHHSYTRLCNFEYGTGWFVPFLKPSPGWAVENILMMLSALTSLSSLQSGSPYQLPSLILPHLPNFWTIVVTSSLVSLLLTSSYAKHFCIDTPFFSITI